MSSMKSVLTTPFVIVVISHQLLLVTKKEKKVFDIKVKLRSDSSRLDTDNKSTVTSSYPFSDWIALFVGIRR